jgi:pimeloyl-ACP methyl ester carboxylesterase
MDPSSHAFEHNGFTLTWQEHGAGDHTFVLIPGWSSPRTAWNDTIQALQPFGRCVTLDLPGHYPAEVPATYTGISLEQLIDLETCAITRISQGQPLTLIGHSTGGLVSLGVAAQLPNQVRRVIVVGGVVQGKLTGILGLAQRVLRAHLYPVYWAAWRLTQLNLAIQMLGMMFYVYAWGAHWRNPMAWRAARATRPLYRHQNLYQIAVLLRLLEGYDISASCTALKMPVLAIVGANDPVVPPEQSRWLGRNLCRAEVKELQQVGHAPFFEAPEQFEGALLEWLGRHPVDDRRPTTDDRRPTTEELRVEDRRSAG